MTTKEHPSIPAEVAERFVTGLQDGTGKRGLWVYGPRVSGTTTAVKKVYTDYPDAFPGDQLKRTAAWIERKTREMWKYDVLIKANGTDFPLWAEGDALEKELDHVWSVPNLWIDDLYPELDITFVRKNMLTLMDESLKAGRVVLVSGNCAPARFGSDWAASILTKYEVVRFADDG